MNIKYSFFGLLLALSLQMNAQERVKGQKVKFNIPGSSYGIIKEGFLNPPVSATPGVYWYFMDGNISGEAMTADLESMKKAGIGKVLFLEVNVGVPRGKVDFLSEEWQELYKHAVSEAKRLGIEITLGIGPGWTGSGGPWVKPEESMQHLVFSSVDIKGPEKQMIYLPKPNPRNPYFGEGVFTKNLKEQWNSFYKDVKVLAFPTPAINGKIGGIDEKALYYREPYTSVVGVKSYLPTAISYPEHPEASIQKDEIRDLSSLLQPDGSLEWNVPSGNWTIMRFGVRNNGAITRPAPYPGLGFECDKFDTIAFRNHFNEYVGKLLRKVGTAKNKSGYGWTMLHMDSWEMGSQNWDSDFRIEFQKRRGYDPIPFLPVYSGRVVANTEQSERFLWDLRQTANELVLENHAGYLKKLCQKYGLGLSIEPYDMNPTSDLDLGAVADIPMCEFWSKGYGFNSSFSCIEATSIANLIGSHIVAAESFTSESFEAWKLYPGALKNQGDWAFCAGINRFFYHTFAHKPLGDQYRPGMTMGPYGVHWDRGQTWWPMVTDYHKYIARCSYMLQQGLRVADILYLTPEGAPHVFRAPKSALIGNDTIPDRKGYNFDGCSPRLLMAKASVMNHQITFPGGANYKLLVLPSVETMTPELLAKIESLVKAGAIVVGNPPKKSPSLVNYPECDAQLRNKALQLWGDLSLPVGLASRVYGNGMIYWGQGLCLNDSTALYPDYDLTASILNQKNVSVDFESTGPIRYTHRETSSQDIYFVSNTTSRQISADCIFRSVKGAPELWDPISCKVFKQLKCMAESGRTKIPMQFDAYQSYFVVFDKSNVLTKGKSANVNNLSTINTRTITTITKPWVVLFDPHWGGPESVIFDKLYDWSKSETAGIKYYSGIAIYKNTINLPKDALAYKNQDLYLELGEVNNIARIKINGRDLGTVWTSPWRVEITNCLKPGNNQIEIEVANLWPNRLIGDEKFPDDGVKDGKWPEWLIEGKPRTSGRYTFTTHHYYTKDSPLLKSGLLGPVRVVSIAFK